MQADPILLELQTSYESGDMDFGRSRLDEWESGQTETYEVLNFVRFHRSLLDQIPEAIDAARSVLDFWEPTDAVRMMNALALTRLYCLDGRRELAWDTLSEVIHWLDQQDENDLGIRQSAIECALDIALNGTVAGELADISFDTAMRLGVTCNSTPHPILLRAWEASLFLGREELSTQLECLVALEAFKNDF